MEDDSAMAYVEEEIPLVPPQVPPDSLLFSTLDLQAPPQNFEEQYQGVDPALDMEKFPVEEETPPTWYDELILVTTQSTSEPQTTVESVLDAPNTFRYIEEHLQLIFDMRRDAVDQIQHHNILCCHLDALFDPLLGNPVKRRCPTYCQPYLFALVRPQPFIDDDKPGSCSV